jgi:uncharacterized membrane protein
VFSLSAAALILAFLITLLEMTEVVALVFALMGESGSIRHGALGAVAGVAVVGVIALGAGAALLAVPSEWLLVGAAVTLYAFGVFLFRSTRRSYHKAWYPSPAGPKGSASSSEQAVQFGGGFTVGVVEAVETVIVLISISAAGQGASAVVGAVAGGVVLVAIALVLHERVRRIKVPWLKLGATSMLFSFAVFWTGEALHVNWPYGDLCLLPLFAVFLLVVRRTVGYLEHESTIPVETNR